MSIYNIARSAVTMVASKDIFSVVAGTTTTNKINEISMVGNGATSAAAAYQEVVAAPMTAAGVTIGTTITPNKWAADNHTSTTTSAFGDTTDPTIGALTTAWVILGCNNYGGIYRWTARPNGEIVTRAIAATGIGGVGAVSLKQTLGTGVNSFNCVFDEL
jgi:hypothetical protein